MTALPVPEHPILACIAEVGAALDRAVDAQAVYLSTEEKAQALQGFAALEARVTAMRLQVMAAAGDLAAASGSRDVAAWWSHHTRTDPDRARADERLASSLDERRSLLAAALAAGRCSVAQARVIEQALDELPDRVGHEVLVAAEAALVDYAEHHRPSELCRLGRRILEVVAPEIADEEEARRLADEERHAREKTRLRLRSLGDGTTRISGRLPQAAASRLRTYLEAFSSPRHAPGTTAAPQDRLPYPRRLGMAFCALLEHLDPDTLPDHGGDATTVMVTLSLDQLKAELAAADLLDGAALTAGEVRRLACTAHLVPAVLGADSEILDLGRARRLFSPAQRRALRLRDRRCRADDCTIPATWTEAHHLAAWHDNGPTDIDNGILLCAHHHQRAHDPRYVTDRLSNGDVRFTRRR